MASSDIDLEQGLSHVGVNATYIEQIDWFVTFRYLFGRSSGLLSARCIECRALSAKVAIGG